MLALKRHLYRLILHLHPASFRNRFAREMALDFEDALATYGFGRLLLDAASSLARQWAAPMPIFFSQGAAAAPASLHPLLAGHYVEIRDRSLTPVELLRGSLLFLILFFIVGAGFNSRTNHLIPVIEQSLPAGHDSGLGVDSGHPFHPTTTGGAARREAEPDYSQLLVVPAPYPYSQSLLRGRSHKSNTLNVNPNSRIQRVRAQSWAEFLLRCALVTLIVWLISFLLRHTRSLLARVALIAFGLLGVTLSAAASPLHISSAHAQLLHSDGPLPSFEVATVKLRDPNSRLLITPPGSQDVVTTVGTAKALIEQAYRVRADLIFGGPQWTTDSGAVYVIEGKIPQELFARMQAMTGDERGNEAHLMMQSLLASRFGLRVHIESREIPVYELTLAKGGAKLPAPNDEKQMGGGESIGKDGVRIGNMTLDGMLAAPWFGLSDRQIVNKTGLTGKYNLTINWLPDIPAQRGPGSEIAAPEGQPSIFTALQEQFGLKLVPTKAPIEVLVIDHIDSPSEN